MSDVAPAFYMFNSEFLNAPLSTLVAALSILTLLYKALAKTINLLLKYRAGYSAVLKQAGIPAFIINLFAISISLKKTPKTGWAERIITIMFLILLLISFIYLFNPSIHSNH